MRAFLQLALCFLLAIVPVRAVVVTSDTSINVPTLPGYSYQCQALGTWGGATVTLQAYVGDTWRALPGGVYTSDFEAVNLASSREMRAVVSGASGATSLTVTWAEVREGDVSAAAAAIAEGGLSIAQVADLPAIFAPVETLPTTLLIRDLFDGGTEVATAAAGTYIVGGVVRITNTKSIQVPDFLIPGSTNIVVWVPVNVVAMRDDSESYLTWGIASSPDTTLAMDSGASYPAGTDPTIADPDGVIMLEVGQVIFAGAVPTFFPAGCGTFHLTHCRGDLGYLPRS